MVTSAFAAIQLRGIALGAFIQELATSIVGLLVVGLALVLLFAEVPEASAAAPAVADHSLRGWSLVIAACVLVGLMISLRGFALAGPAAVTVSFLTLAFGKLFFVFNLRNRHSRLIHNDIVRNPWLWCSLLLCTGLLLAAVYLPGLSGVLRTRALSGRPWLLVLALSLVPMLMGQIWLVIRKRRDRATADGSDEVGET